jgi:predicted DNA-binding transcriptional regulator AlpA
MVNPFETIFQQLAQIHSDIRELRQSLQPMPEQPKERQGGKKLAMEVTGLSESSIYKLSMKNAIPCARRNGRLWFYESQLKVWLELGMPNWSEYKANQRVNEKLK